jgi:diguanylate cyclase
MNDKPHRPDSSSDEDPARLASLHDQVAAMRKVLVQLLQDVVVAEARLDHGEASLLKAANERLTISVLGAQQDADTAHGALDEASRLNGLDALTGLPNRTVLLDRFELAIANAKRHGNRVALLFLDIDAFKEINDTFGHASGDHALQLVSACLSSLVRETDTVSRHGGDEFLVLLAEVASAADAQIVADKVNAALALCDSSDSQPMSLRASMGIAVFPEDGADARALIAFADAAMYRAKRQHAGQGVVHADESQGLAASTAVSPAPRQHVGSEPGAAHVEQEQQQKPQEKQQDKQQDKQQQWDLREANESLLLAALGAQSLLAAAKETGRRQTALLALVANELSDPFAPIRLAASTLGISGAEAVLLSRAQLVIEEQAEKLARLVRQALEPQGRDQDPSVAEAT